MKKLTSNQQLLSDDILRYKKNKLASTFALLGLAFNCLYFLLLYAMPKEEFRTITIGFSIVLTLVILLITFLSSEGVKGYNKKFSIVLLVIAVIQILRIFYYPLKGIQGNLFVNSDDLHYIGYFGAYWEDSTPLFIILVFYLVASAACLIFSAVWGYIVAMRLEKLQKKIDDGEVSIESTLAALDAEEAEAQSTLVSANAAVAETETSSGEVE